MTVPVGDLQLRVSRLGTGRPGPAVLLVHGWGGAGSVWYPIAARLAASHHVVWLDLRGHGGSGSSARHCTVGAMSSDLAALCARLGLNQVVAVGHSMGGQVVSRLAVEHPDLVAGLVVIDPAYGADADELAGAPARLGALERSGAESLLPWLDDAFSPATPQWVAVAIREQLLSTPASVLADSFRSMYLDEDAFGATSAAVHYLRARRCPTLALYPDRSRAECERQVAAATGRTHIVCWPGSGHFLHLERVADTVGLVDRFTATLRNGLSAMLGEAVEDQYLR